MADLNKQSSKAAGTSDRRRIGTSRPQPRRLHEQPEARVPSSQVHDIDNEHDRDSPYASTRQGSGTSASERPLAHKQPQEASQISDSDDVDEEDAANENPCEDWDLLEHEAPARTSVPTALSSPPSYNFPTPWSAALNDTSNALTQVTAASTSYATALSQSGMGKAGWSIGSALASSAKKSALSVAEWGLEKSGKDVEELPAPVRKWLGGRGQRGGRRGGRRVMRDERGAFVLETHDLDATGEFVKEGAGDDEGAEVEGEVGEDGLVRMFRYDD
ncbi:Nn.00g090160.m01.CDS01 [Neocucurbitaria sp. VM-36]